MSKLVKYSANGTLTHVYDGDHITAIRRNKLPYKTIHASSKYGKTYKGYQYRIIEDHDEIPQQIEPITRGQRLYLKAIARKN